MRRVHIYKKKKNYKISIIIFIIVIGIFCSYMLIDKFSNRVSDIFLSYAEAKITNLMTLVINESVENLFVNNFSDEDLFNIIQDSEGNIKLIDFNSLNTTKILNQITKTVAVNLKMIENGNVEILDLLENSLHEYDREKLRYGIIYEMPMGVITKNNFLASMGPKIPVRMKVVGDVISNIQTDIKEYGINNAMINIGVKVDVSGMVNIPFAAKKITVSTVIPLSLKVIQGNIPNYYLNGIKSSSNLFGVS